MEMVDRFYWVSSAIAPTARALAAALPGSAGVWTAGVRAMGTEGPATGYVLNGPVAVQFDDALQSPAALVSMLAEYGQTLTIEQATYLLSQFVKPADPTTTGFAAMAELNLELVPE